MEEVQPPTEKGASRYTYEPLDGREFKRRIESGFSDVYLTSISIIQGIALTFLCEEVFRHDRSPELIGGDIPIPYVLMTFGTIVGVSFEYNWFVGTHRYSYKFIDTLIPYVIGFFEIGAVFNLKETSHWWFWMGLMYFSGMIAYVNSLIHYRRDGFADDEVYYMFRKNMLRSIWIVAVSATLCLTTFFTYSYLVDKFSRNIDYLYLLIYTAFLTALLLKNALFLKKLHQVFHFKH